MEKPIVSVIILVYNMKDMIEKCLDSVISQTYKNIEVIIVNDGSTDNSGDIAEKYKVNDERVKVIHHDTNKGIAAGFNTGIRNANGDYVVFVDSDNYIDKRMIEILVEETESTGADIVQCAALCYTEETEAEATESKNEMNPETSLVTLEGEEIVDDYLKAKTITNNLAAKIIKLKMFENIVIPEGHQVVDAITLMQLICKCNKYVCTNHILYYAYQAPNSISRSSISERRLEDLLFSNDFTCEFVKNNWPKWADYIAYRNIRVSNWAYNQVYLSELDYKDQRLKNFRNLFSENYKKAQRTEYYKNMSKSEKYKYALFYTNIALYNILLKKRFGK